MARSHSASIALAAGSQAFIVVASDVAGNSSEVTQTIMTTASDTSAPVITAALANDTGISNTDGITSDPTITGVVDDPSGVASFQASLDGGAMMDATSYLSGEGFTLTRGRPGDVQRRDGLARRPAHGLRFRRRTASGINRRRFTVSFTLESTRPLPPSNVHLHRERPDTARARRITKDRSLTVLLSAPAGTIVTLYMNGTPDRPADGASLGAA